MRRLHNNNMHRNAVGAAFANHINWSASGDVQRYALMRRIRLIRRCLLGLAAITSLYVVSWAFAAGGIHYFSPHTLQTYAHQEILLPFTEIPIYRSAAQTYHYDLTQYLMDESYWAPDNVESPPFVTSRWNQQWRDGQSDLHRQFSWKAEQWIEWTESHREIAAKLWPLILQLLRADSRSGKSYASNLMFLAQMSETLDQFNQFISDHSELKSAVASITRP